MKYTYLGRTGLKVSRLCLGTMNFGPLTDETDAYPGGIVVSSVRLAKGLEFDEVVVLDADERFFSGELGRSLLYVAVTRALHRLTVLHRGRPSRFLAE